MNIITKNNFKLESNTFLLINKPEGWTSFDVVGYIRKIFRQQNPEVKKPRVGHAGTLDPFATGLLIVAIGREATQEIENFKNLPKTYEATVKLGETSDTGDKTGVITQFKINFLNKLILNIKYWILKKTFEKVFLVSIFRNHNRNLVFLLRSHICSPDRSHNLLFHIHKVLVGLIHLNSYFLFMATKSSYSRYIIAHFNDFVNPAERGKNFG